MCQNLDWDEFIKNYKQVSVSYKPEANGANQNKQQNKNAQQKQTVKETDGDKKVQQPRAAPVQAKKSSSRRNIM